MLVNPCCCGAPTVYCTPCRIPEANLTLSWTNSMLGNGSATLTYNAPNVWRSVCTNEIIFALVCAAGSMQLSVTYFLSGECPTGQSQACIGPGSAPFGLTLADYTCSPFHFHYRVTGVNCPLIWESGYTDFYVNG